MARKKAGRAGLDQERERRREFERLKAEQEAVRPDLGADAAQSPDPKVGPLLQPAAFSARAELEPSSVGVRLPGQDVHCAWCGSSTPVKSRGPLPRFCSANCRHRAWEQRRAARDGRAAITIVDRFVTTYPGTTSAWVLQLDRLANEVLDGRLDAEALSAPLDALQAAIAHRRRDDLHDEPW